VPKREQVQPKPVKPPAVKEPSAPPPPEKAVSKIEEVQQEKPAARETKPEKGEFIAEQSEVEGEHQGVNATEENQASAWETEGEASTEPALPPLGQAGGMVGFVPRFTYPKSAEHLGAEGKVLMELYLTPEGTLLKEPMMLASSGHVALDEHCRRMFTSQEWKFKPASQPYKMQVEIDFSKNEVKTKFIGEAAYLSTEEGGEQVE
jgi:TonB family protein